MLKQQKRHSQTLSTKKPKPIEITLTKKGNHNNMSYNYGQENLNQSIEKGVRQGLSLVRPLKQKSSNIPESQTFDLKSLKSRQQKLKQQVCPSYKLNWGSTPINNNNNNSSRLSQMSSFVSSQQPVVQQLSHLIKTVEYKKYAREVHDNQNLNLGQFHMSIDEGLEVIKEQQPVGSREVKQGSTMNSVKSKIKGITKGFLRDGKNECKQLENQERKSSQVVKLIHVTEQNQSSVTQVPQEVSLNQTYSLLVPQQTKQPLPEQTILLPQQSQNDSSTQQPLTQRSALKQRYAELSVRLEQCVEQIVEIQRNNNVEKIVELEHEILELKNNHQQEKLQMIKKIQELEGKLAEKQSNRNHLSVQRKTIHLEIKPSFSPISQISQDKIASYQAEIKQLRQKVSSLTQSLHSQSFHLDSSFSHRSSLQLQNQIYETDILKRKQSTLEQVLDLKKKQIVNKDSIIQMLLSKQVEKALMNNDPTIKNSQDKKDKVTALVFEMIGYMNGKLSSG